MNKYGLRQCPFCGSEETALFERKDELSELPVYGVTCLNCFVALAFTATKETPLEFQPFTNIRKTKEMWNRRQ